MSSWPGFLGPANKSQSFMADAELLKNWLLEANQSPTAPNPWAMVPCPGFSAALWAVTEAPIRGEFYQNGRAFFVAGTVLYEGFANGTTTSRGSVVADAHPVTFNANGDAGNQLWITSGGVGYVFDLTSNTLSVQGVPGTTVTMGGFLKARFLYLDADSGAFYASALYDGTSWSALMVAQSESGNPWRALIVTPDSLIRLLGEFSGQAYADTGAFPFPFTQVQEANIPYGIVAPFAWAVDTTLTWLAQNQQGRGIVVRAQGYQPQPISTHAIETAIQGYADLSDVTAFAYQENGHSFTLFTFPNPDVTWCFDQTSNLWHERAYWDTTTATFKAYRPGCCMEAFGKLLVGDRLTGNVYEMKSSYFTDVDGAVIRRMRQAPRFSVDQKLISVSAMQIVMDAGMSLSTGQGSDAQMMVEISKDGGQTFGNVRTASIGPMGTWGARVRWNQFGQGRNWVPRFTATDPVPDRIVDLLIDFEVGSY